MATVSDRPGSTRIVLARHGEASYPVGSGSGDSGGTLTVGIPGGEDGHQVAMRMFAVLDDLVEQFDGESVLAVSHGGAVIAILGSIAAGEPGLPADGNDMPGGASYSFEHGPDGWRLLPSERHGPGTAVSEP